MKEFFVKVEATVVVRFDDDRATEVSASHVAQNNWTYGGRSVDIKSASLGRVVALQDGDAKAVEVRKTFQGAKR